MESRVVLEEVFAMSEKGGKRGFERTGNRDFRVERLAAAFFPKDCKKWMSASVTAREANGNELTRNATAGLDIREA